VTFSSKSMYIRYTYTGTDILVQIAHVKSRVSDSLLMFTNVAINIAAKMKCSQNSKLTPTIIIRHVRNKRRCYTDHINDKILSNIIVRAFMQRNSDMIRNTSFVITFLGQIYVDLFHNA
jgi:hypothetical protein